LVNDGTFETVQDQGNNRYIEAPLTNNGTVEIDAAGTIQDQSTATVNNGTWIIGPGLDFHGTAGTWTQTASGTLVVTVDPATGTSSGVLGGGMTMTLGGTLEVDTPGSIAVGKTVAVLAEPLHGAFADERFNGASYAFHYAADGVGATALPPPQPGVSVDVAPVSGKVKVELPRGVRFHPLHAGERIPVGSTIDTTAGTIALTAAVNKHGKTTNGSFYDGIFKVGQQHAGGGELTDLTLSGGAPSGCGTAGDAADARGRPHRRLWGDATGNFQTVGHYASATERGTKWLTQDSCAGTLIQVVTDSVIVHDFVTHRTFRLRAPRSYLARP
jgi:hypothetical protein